MVLKHAKGFFQRDLQNNDFQIKFYSAWVLISLTIIGGLGIFNSYKSLDSKIETLAQLKTTNSNIETNLYNVRLLSYDIEQTAGSFAYLDRYMPETFNEDLYLLDMITTLADTEFEVKSVTTSNSSNNVQLLTLKIRGKGDFSELMNRIENMKRLSSIKSASFTLLKSSTNYNEMNVDLNLEIFMRGRDL